MVVSANKFKICSNTEIKNLSIVIAIIITNIKNAVCENNLHMQS